MTIFPLPAKPGYEWSESHCCALPERDGALDTPVWVRLRGHFRLLNYFDRVAIPARVRPNVYLCHRFV